MECVAAPTCQTTFVFTRGITGAFSQITWIQVGPHSRHPLKAHKVVWHRHGNLQGAAVITVPQRKAHRKSVDAPIGINEVETG